MLGFVITLLLLHCLQVFIDENRSKIKCFAFYNDLHEYYTTKLPSFFACLDYMNHQSKTEIQKLGVPKLLIQTTSFAPHAPGLPYYIFLGNMTACVGYHCRTKEYSLVEHHNLTGHKLCAKTLQKSSGTRLA